MIASDPFRLAFQSLVQLGLAASAIAKRAGLSAASEVWGGDEPRERPAWYLWLRDRPGAWQVELAAVEPLEGPGDALVGRFTVRHYPAPGTPELTRFSAEERRIAADALDETGTPRIELASRIPEHCFTVGSLDWAIDRERDLTAFAFASLDRLRTRSEEGAVARDVPGWALTAPVFSLVASLHAQVHRREAARIVVSRQRGFEVLVSPEGARTRESADTIQGEAALLFHSLRAPAERAASLMDAMRDREADVIADLSFEEGAQRPHAIRADPRLPLEVSHAWFGGEAHLCDGVMCGC